MTIEAEQDIVGLVKVGRVVGAALHVMQESIRPGMTTRELDNVGEVVFRKHGARSAPRLTYKFPGATCISINDEAAHGIPGERVIQEGDLVKIDISAELAGYFADANLTVPVGTISPRKQQLIDCTRSALKNAMAAARAGRPINVIGRAAETTAEHCGFKVIRELPGHGVGRALHESPSVPNFYLRRANSPLRAGMVITIEPHIAMGAGQIVTERDGWTLKTRDGSAVASFEHTIVITDDEPILITAV
jgi:methionyl aminopeptidase